ncbi:MAG: hypothetical protein LBU90_10500 [Bacteroidales bacterium]|jgi:hypothetical protein|nr:hypothetical protein [Bacteroidales bacterium]
MARTISEIKKEITDDFVSNPAVVEAYGLEQGKSFEEQFSKASLESILFYLHAAKIWLLETLFDTHREEINTILQSKRPHTVGWYRGAALEFQFGRELRADVAEYDNSELSEDEIAAERIVSKCAVEKAEFAEKPTLTIKVAKAATHLTDAEKTAFEKYMSEKADAGVRLNIISGAPDRLWLSIIIRHDGLVLNGSGERLYGGSEKPVEKAVKNHLNKLVFNGTFFPSLLEQELMRLPGVKIATVQASQACPAGGTLTQFVDKYQPLTGALDIDTENDLRVEYELI